MHQTLGVSSSLPYCLCFTAIKCNVPHFLTLTLTFFAMSRPCFLTECNPACYVLAACFITHILNCFIPRLYCCLVFHISAAKWNFLNVFLVFILIKFFLHYSIHPSQDRLQVSFTICNYCIIIGKSQHIYELLYLFSLLLLPCRLPSVRTDGIGVEIVSILF